MELLGDLVMRNLISVRLGTMLVLVQDRCTVGAKCTTGSEKSFWTHKMELLGDVGHVESRFGPLEVVLLLM
jgi:hypothetical protein